MPKYLHSAEKIKLNSYNDLFGEEVEAQNIGDKLIEVPLSDLHEFKGHPFKVRDDEEMERLVESIREYGVLHPGIARPMKKGKGYELIAGHRRKHASEIAGKETMPVFIRDYDNDEATIIMVDSNLQREEILPSEKAKAYRMKFEAIKHQGKGGGLTIDNLGEAAGESGKTVQRFIRLSYLSDDLLSRVDDKEIGIRQGVNLSYLRETEQKLVTKVMQSQNTDVSIEKTNRLRKMSYEGELTLEDIAGVLIKVAIKKPAGIKVSIDGKRLREFFPEETSETEMTEVIYKLLDHWSRGEYG